MPSDSRPAAPSPETPHLNEERLRLAVEATGLGTWDLDPLTGALHWDERCKALFGVPPDASLDYDTFLSLVHPEDREHVHHVVQQALDPTGSGAYRLDYRAVDPRDGRVRWLSTFGRAFFDASGRAVRFLGTVLDITERVREREAAERERSRVTTLLENISEAFDRDWRFIYVNREAERLVGRPREELLGRNHWELYPDTVGPPWSTTSAARPPSASRSPSRTTTSRGTAGSRSASTPPTKGSPSSSRTSPSASAATRSASGSCESRPTCANRPRRPCASASARWRSWSTAKPSSSWTRTSASSW
jgi:PAS domain S-box-containing protein